MATNEERLDVLEERIVQNEAGSITLLGIVREIDTNTKILTGAVQSIQVNGTIMDVRLATLDAKVSALDAKVERIIQLLSKQE